MGPAGSGSDSWEDGLGVRVCPNRSAVPTASTATMAPTSKSAIGHREGTFAGMGSSTPLPYQPCLALGLAEDGVAADTTPADPGLAAYLDPLEGWSR